eukprot:TRINITY_DN3353_c0_g3_i1.p2 TRINITY_DN3353_c0_g3~~TRINITY_DN3353_c0_g3_i1.p2  ORF type:complete len:296 (-),score=22.40 TRINITY_DN3353_c0_g3_i1:305-1096(-)
MKGNDNNENSPPESLYPPGQVYWILPKNLQESIAPDEVLEEVSEPSQPQRASSGFRAACQKLMNMSSGDLRDVKSSVERSITQHELDNIQHIPQIQPPPHFYQYPSHLDLDDRSVDHLSVDASAFLSSILDEEMEDIKPVSEVGKRDVEWLNQWLLHHNDDFGSVCEGETMQPLPVRKENGHRRSRSFSDRLVASLSRMKKGLSNSLSRGSLLWNEQNVQKQQDRSELVLVKADRKCFNRLLLSMELLSDHFPDVYLAAIKSL